MPQPQPNPSETDLLPFLESIDLFKTCDEAMLRTLITEMERVSLQPGEILFHQGDPGGGLYLVFHGRLQVTITRKDGQNVVVAEVGPGKPLGEIQFLTGGTRTARVSALEQSDLVTLSKHTYERLAEQKPDIIHHIAAIIRHRLRRDQLVITLPEIFGRLDADMLKAIEHEAEWLYLEQGEALFRQGDPGDSFFLLVSGRLHVTVRESTGQERMVTEIRRGEIVGEMAVFTGETRSASATAARYSEVVTFSRAAFERIITRYPTVTMHVMQVMIRRLQRSHTSYQQGFTGVNIAIIPAHHDVPLSEFTRRLTGALESVEQNMLHVTSQKLDTPLGIAGIAQTPENAPNNIRLAAWLDEQETRYRVIIYEADAFPSPWTTRCIQRADRILIVAQAQAGPAPGEIERKFLCTGKRMTNARATLVLIHPNGETLPSGTKEWLAVRQVQSHQHLRWNRDEDFARLARFVSGHAFGLVLGGGGARGLAHIGVIRALKEAGIPIDLIGGTSIGGAVAAQFAMGMNDEQMMKTNRLIWIDSKPFHDYTLPLLSLIKGRKFEQLAHQVYGGALIEDLWVNYFCVSTNITTTDVVAHRDGPLANALRATASLPGVAVPLIKDRQLLVDGGVLNNLPIDVMRELCEGIVIAVNVSMEKELSVEYTHYPSPWKVLWNRIAPFHKPLNVPTIFDLLMRTTIIGSLSKTHAVKTQADLYIQPPLNQFKLLDFKAMEKIVDVGYEYTRRCLEEWEHPLRHRL